MKLILLPGMDGTGHFFSALTRRLESWVEPVVVSYPQEELLGYKALKTYVEAFLPDGEDYIILGESFSGPVAIDIAAESPAGLAGVILCCSFASTPKPLLLKFGQIVPLGILPGVARSLALLGSLSDKVGDTSLQEVLATVPERVLRYRIGEVARCNVESSLASIRVPMLYMRATKDRLIPRQMAEHITAKAVNAEIVDIEGPHMLLQVNPEAASRAVMDFAVSVSAKCRS